MRSKKLWVALAMLLVVTLSLSQELGDENKGTVDFFASEVEIEGMGVAPARLKDNPPAAYLAARRAAQIMANANLASMLSGLYIQAVAEIADSGAEYREKVREELQKTHIPGGRIVKQTAQDEFGQTGTVTVVVRYKFSEVMPSLLGGGRAEQLRTATGKLPMARPAMQQAASTDYDGLIINVPDGFKPSIAPKVYNNKEELVYGANTLAMDVLMNQGVAQFTNNSGKAKATLEQHGSQAPLVVRGSLRGSTDVTLNDDDAGAILNANGKNSFLQKGRVVIVIGGSQGD